MKKLLFKSLFIGAMSLCSTQAFSQCENVNGDMQTYTGTPAGVAWINEHLENWYVSHAIAGFVGTDVPSGGTDVSIHLVNVASSGEGGVYTEHDFKKDTYYTLSYEVDNISFIDEDSEPSKVIARLANGLTPQPVGTFPPSFAGTQVVSTAIFSTSSSAATITITFKANDDYEQLWFHLEIPSSAVVFNGFECAIDNVCITEQPCHVIDNAAINMNHSIATGPIFMPAEAVEAVDFTLTGLPETDYLVSYSWDFGDGLAGSFSENPRHYFYSRGPFEVCVTVTYRDPETLAVICTRTICEEIRLDISKPGKFKAPATSTDTPTVKNISQLSAYPNPGDGNFILDNTGEAIQTVYVYDQMGKIVFQTEGLPTNNIQRIDLTGLAPGIYLLIANPESESASKTQLVIQ